MSDKAAVLEQLQALLGQFQANGGPTAGAAPSPLGVAVPVEVESPVGLVTIYLSFPPEAIQNPIGLIQSLMSQGLRVRAFQPRFGGGGPRRFFGNRNGYGGGWNGGGGYGAPRNFNGSGGGWQGGGW